MKIKNKYKDVNKFNVKKYVEKNYSKDVLEKYKDVSGLNGLDNLWSCKNESEVNSLLNDYVDFEIYDSCKIVEEIDSKVEKLLERLNDESVSDNEKVIIENYLYCLEEKIG